MKDWPEDKNTTVDLEELLAPIKDAIKFGYNLNRKNIGKNCPYEGYNIGERDLPHSLDPLTLLSSESLKRQREQGRDYLDACLLLAFQMGIEQQRRLQQG